MNPNSLISEGDSDFNVDIHPLPQYGRKLVQEIQMIEADRRDLKNELERDKRKRESVKEELARLKARVQKINGKLKNHQNSRFWLYLCLVCALEARFD